MLQLITLRSNSQFNTTIYNDDRFRGIYAPAWSFWSTATIWPGWASPRT